MNVKLNVGKTFFQKTICIIGAYLLYILLVLLSAVITYYFNAPPATLSIISYCALIVGIFVASCGSAYYCGKRGWLNGMLCAAVYLAFILITGILVKGEACNIIGFLYKTPLLLAVACVCGGIGINIRKK